MIMNDSYDDSHDDGNQQWGHWWLKNIIPFDDGYNDNIDYD